MLVWACTEEEELQRQSGNTILVVEDDAPLCEMLRILLEDSGCRIVAVTRGREALELARTERPDLITLDLRLPDMDGHEVLNRLGREPDLADVPVIVISARPFKRSGSGQVVAVIPKPFDAQALEAVILRTLRRRGKLFGDAAASRA